MRFKLVGLVGLAACAIVAACNTTSRMEIPVVESVAPPIIDVSTDEQASFALHGVVATLRRGDVIAHFPGFGVDGVEGYACNKYYSGDATLEWGSGRSNLGNWQTELGEVFFDVMRENNVNVKGDPSRVFGRDDEALSAEFLIGANIKKINGNFCEPTSFWTGAPTNEFSGEMYVEIEWTIYSATQKREVFRFETNGYAKQIKPKREGVIITFHNAFAEAAARITTSPEFLDVARREADLDTTAALSGGDGPIVIDRLALARTDISDSIETIASSVVTLRAGAGHGSGFFISTDGLIMTNAHVVSESKTVGVVLNNGLELMGEVLRYHRPRDVALVKVDLRVPNALPIRAEPAAQLERVFAIGSPLLEALKTTVTGGVVSAYRRFAPENMLMIQADVPITSGNSGGPLLDQQGNVVGLSVAGFSRGESLNLFIPIMDGLEKLEVRIAAQTAERALH